MTPLPHHSSTSEVLVMIMVGGARMAGPLLMPRTMGRRQIPLFPQAALGDLVHSAAALIAWQAPNEESIRRRRVWHQPKSGSASSSKSSGSCSTDHAPRLSIALVVGHRRVEPDGAGPLRPHVKAFRQLVVGALLTEPGATVGSAAPLM